MLTRTDRLALAVPSADEAVATYAALFDTEVVADGTDDVAGARRVSLRWGRDTLELYEPTADGPVSAFLDEGRRGIFAGGFTADDPAAVAARLEAAGVDVHERDDGAFIVMPADLDGTGVILSEPADHPRIGLNDKIWQITYAVPDLQVAVDRYTELFGLREMFTNFYEHRGFGYLGAITWFDARDGGLLDSLEYLEPNDDAKAVARFVGRSGQGIYMASIETDDVAAIAERVTSTGEGWQGTDFGGFIHPRRTHGLLLGLVTYQDWNSRRPLP